jgi:hypothetical protein
MNYKKIAEEALKKAQESNGVIPTSLPKRLDESLVYPDGMRERMHPQLEQDLINQKTSLGKHPIFPEGDEYSFEQKIMGERFKEVSRRYKSTNSLDEINNDEAAMGLMGLVRNGMMLEGPHKKSLEDLAIKMVREEFDMSEEMVEINAELTPSIDIQGTKLNPTPVSQDYDFKNHEEMVNAKDEVYKRRFVNAMIQGAAKKCNHMFHMVEDELSELDPKLTNLYSKMMSSADYMYYIKPDMENGVNGGVVRVEFPTKNNPKTTIHAQAMVFPVLIHELVKGVMEILSARGLPKDKMGKYVINKADYLKAESWDMRLGPALWERFVKLFDADDFKYKHHVWNELVGLPVKEFNEKMKEIMAGTSDGKKIISDIVNDVKHDLKQDEFKEAMEEIVKNDEEQIDTFEWDQIMGSDEDESDEEGFNYEELF